MRYDKKDTTVTSDSTQTGLDMQSIVDSATVSRNCERKINKVNLLINIAAR